MHTTLKAVEELGSDQRETVLDKLRTMPASANLPESADIHPAQREDHPTVALPITPTTPKKDFMSENPFERNGRSTSSDTSSRSSPVRPWQDAQEKFGRYETLLTMLLNAPVHDVADILGRLRGIGDTSPSPTEVSTKYRESLSNVDTISSSVLAEIVQQFLENRSSAAEDNQHNLQWRQKKATTQSHRPVGESRPSITDPDTQLPEFFLWNQLKFWTQQAQMVPALFGDFARDLDDHIAIVGVTQGWDVVRRQVTLCPQWEILAEWDRQIHYSCRIIDRLAAVRILRQGMKFYSAPNPTSEEVQSSIPTYLRPLAAQAYIAPGNVVNYIPWPAVRARILTGGERYTLNDFWRHLFASFRFQWSGGEKSDAYQTHYSETMMAFSADFLTAFEDIDTWTLTKEFLDQYPEFQGKVRQFEPESEAFGKAD